MPPIPGSQSTESGRDRLRLLYTTREPAGRSAGREGRKGIATYSLYIPLNKFPTAKTRYARSGPRRLAIRLGERAREPRLPLRNFDHAFPRGGRLFAAGEYLRGKRCFSLITSAPSKCAICTAQRYFVIERARDADALKKAGMYSRVRNIGG